MSIELDARASKSFEDLKEVVIKICEELEVINDSIDDKVDKNKEVEE